jgi:hypothetical protein
MNGRSWAQRRRINDKLAPRVAIRDVRVRPAKYKKGYYEVWIRGFGFRPWAVPPDVRIGGTPVVELQFAKDGTAICGLVQRRPPRREVEVDLGYARARWAPP